MIFIISCETSQSNINKLTFIAPKNIGIDFKHDNAHSEKFRFPEIMGAGVATIDFDLDGDQDLYFVQSANGDMSDQLYKSLLIESGELKFINYTKQAKINQKSYGIGISIGDFNNDKFPDIYLSNLTGNILLENNNGEYFEDITNKVGLPNNNYFSVDASFVDLNNNGWLDLVSSNNIKYNEEFEQQCKTQYGLDYCGPSSYSYEKNIIFKNNKGIFSQLDQNITNFNLELPSLVVSIFDYNSDGLSDIYIANDEKENTLWVNQGDFTFKENALLAGLAVNSMAKVEASMGVAIGDINKNSLLDLYLTHLWQETNTLYVQNKTSQFDDETNQYNLSQSSFPYTGFGTHFFDLENDGNLDIFVVNGSIFRNNSKDYENGYLENNLIYKGTGKKFIQLDNQLIFSEFSEQNSRGLIRTDLDNDGDSDFVITNNNSTPEIYINDHTFENNWIGYSAFDENGLIQEHNESMAVYENNIIRNIQTRTGSYASSSDPRVLMGLGKYNSEVSITIRWNQSEFEKFNLEPNKYHKLIKGQGVKVQNWPTSNTTKLQVGSEDELDKALTELFKEPISVNIKTHIQQLRSENKKIELCYSFQSYEFISQASICYKKHLSESSPDQDYYLAASNEINAFNYTLAHTYLDKVIKNNKNNWLYCYRKSQIFFYERNFDAAYKTIENCNHAQYTVFNLKMKGDISFQNQDYKSAFKYYREVLKIRPDANHVYYQLADSLKMFNTGELEIIARSRAGNRTLTVDDPISSVLNSYIKDPVIFLNRAINRNTVGDIKSAIYLMNKAYKLDPKSERIIRTFAIILIRNNQLNDALNLFTAHQEDLKDIQSFVTYSLILQELKQHEKSLKILSKANTLFPSNLDILIPMAELQYQLKQYDSAKQTYKSILILDPNNTVAHIAIEKMETDNK